MRRMPRFHGKVAYGAARGGTTEYEHQFDNYPVMGYEHQFYF